MTIETIEKNYPKLFKTLPEDTTELRYLLVIDENYNDDDTDEFDAIDPEDFNYLLYVTDMLQEAVGEPKIIEKVQKGLKEIEVGEASTLPYLLDLLSVKDSGIDNIPMSPEARKERITGAVKRITLKGSEARPLIIAIEDLHWIDKGSEGYFKDLLDHISGVKIFLIFTYRPEFDPTWS